MLSIGGFEDVKKVMFQSSGTSSRQRWAAASGHNIFPEPFTTGSELLQLMGFAYDRNTVCLILFDRFSQVLGTWNRHWIAPQAEFSFLPAISSISAVIATLLGGKWWHRGQEPIWPWAWSDTRLNCIILEVYIIICCFRWSVGTC